MTADKIAAAVLAAMTVPTGYKLVPVEPTTEMIEAGRPRPPQWDKTESSRKLRLTCDDMRRKDWAAMLAAAPEVPRGAPMTRAELREAVAQQVEAIIAREIHCGQAPETAPDDPCKATWLPYRRRCPECPLHYTARPDLAREMADAALAVALPILQQHYAEVAEDASGSMGPVIAAAIRADEGP